MIAIEQNIEDIRHEAEQSVSMIIEGSEEHTNLIITVGSNLNELTSKLKSLNSMIAEDIGKSFFTNNNYKDFVEKFKLVSFACFAVTGAIKTSALFKDIDIAFANFAIEHETLREYIHDIHNVIAPKDQEFDNLLNDINDL